MRNVGLDEALVGIKISGRKINNLSYADDITLMAESKEELKNLLRKVKEESDNAPPLKDYQDPRLWAHGEVFDMADDFFRTFLQIQRSA